MQPALAGREPGVVGPAEDGEGDHQGEEEGGDGQEGVEPVGVVGRVVLLVPRFSPAKINSISNASKNDEIMSETNL